MKSVFSLLCLSLSLILASANPFFDSLKQMFKPKDCTDYQKIVNGTCATDCLSDMVGICPVALIVKTGQLQKGNCKDQGYTVADGTTKQKAGPCGTLTFNMYKKPTIKRLGHHISSDADCTDYQKVVDGVCATDCLGNMVGICPVSLVTATGKLEKGNCKSQGYTVSNGTTKQKAGPCGTLTFQLYNKPARTRQLSTCANYSRIDDGICSESCLNSMLGFCPVSLVANFGKLDARTCASRGFHIPNGTTNQKAGMCGRITFRKYRIPVINGNGRRA